MDKLKQLGAGAALAALAGAAPAGDIAGNVTLASDYTFRGISQTDEHPAIQGGFDYAHDSGLFVGTWASNVDFNDGDEASTEVDLYGGMAGTLANGIGWKFSAIYYAYPGVKDNTTLDYDYWEFGPALTFPIGGATLSATVLYSPDFFFDSGDSVYGELGLSAPVGPLTLGGTFGHQDIDRNTVNSNGDGFGAPDYNTWTVFASATYLGVTGKLAYVDTNLSRAECFGGLDWCESRAVFSISKAL